MLLPNWGKPLFFWIKRFRQSKINEKFSKKKKEFPSTFNSKSIHVRRHFAQYSYANFQIFTAAYNFDNKTLLYNNNCKSLMYCQHIPNSFFILNVEYMNFTILN